MLAGLRSYAQSLANTMMTTPVTIRNRSTQTKDPSNKSGDDITEWASPFTVNGWFLDPGAATLDDSGGMGVSVDKPTVRLPVGTTVTVRAELTINGTVWTADDISNDETWPAMLRVSLIGEQ